MRHHHTTIVELRPDHTKIMSHPPSMKSTCIPTSFQYTINHPTTFHTYIMPNSSIPTHTIRSYMHIQILHTLNRVIQTKLTINNQKHGQGTTMEQMPAPVSLKPKILAQEKEVFRLSERPSLRRKRSSSKINLFTSVSLGTHTLPWNLSILSLPKAKSFTLSDLSCSSTLFKLVSNNCLSLTEFEKSLDIVRVLHLINLDPNSTCSFMSLNFSSSSTSLIIRYVVCTAFLLKAFATTFTFPGWYKSSKL